MAEAQVLTDKLDGLIGEYTERKISRTERMLGPELYRIVKGIFTYSHFYCWVHVDRNFLSLVAIFVTSDHPTK